MRNSPRALVLEPTSRNTHYRRASGPDKIVLPWKDRSLSPGKADDPARIKEWLESIKPGDFDKLERGKDPDRPEE